MHAGPYVMPRTSTQAAGRQLNWRASLTFENFAAMLGLKACTQGCMGEEPKSQPRHAGLC